MTVAVRTDNEMINEDIQLFRQALGDDDELLGERLKTLIGISAHLNFCKIMLIHCLAKICFNDRLPADI